MTPRPSWPAHAGSLTSYANRDAYATDFEPVALRYRAPCPACGVLAWWHCGPHRQPAPDCTCDRKEAA